MRECIFLLIIIKIFKILRSSACTVKIFVKARLNSLERIKGGKKDNVQKMARQRKDEGKWAHLSSSLVRWVKRLLFCFKNLTLLYNMVVFLHQARRFLQNVYFFRIKREKKLAVFRTALWKSIIILSDHHFTHSIFYLSTTRVMWAHNIFLYSSHFKSLLSIKTFFTRKKW